MPRFFVALLLFAAFGVAAGLGATPLPGPTVAPEVDRAVAEVRWRSMTPAERAEMERRYARFATMNSAERANLRRRAERLDTLTTRLYRSLEPDVRRRVDRLAPEQRRTVLREMVAQEAHETSQRILRKLPVEVRARVENATPEDRARYLRDYKRKALRVDRGLERLGPDIGMTEVDIERLKAMPEPVRRGKFLELVQRRFDKWVERHDLPEGLTEEGWQHVRAMPPPEFLSAVMRLRELHPEFGNFPVRGTGSRAGLRRLLSVLRLPPQAYLDSAELPAEERRARREHMKRELAMQVIREEQLVDEESLAGLETATNLRFFVEVRTLLSELQAVPDPPREPNRAEHQDR